VINADPELEVVAQSGDTQTGLSQITTLQPDVALVDINMPGPSVFDMVQVALKQLPNLKFIFLTAHHSDINVERALASGASGFVTKAESLTTIAHAVHEVLSGRSPFLSDDVRGKMISTGRSDASPLQITTRRNLLSPREVEVLCYVAHGQSAKQIAGVLDISAKTVERHKSNIMAKLNLHTQVDLTRYAIREGIISA
jgi:two-component system response regulator NreC